MQQVPPHSEPWGEFVDVKLNAVEALQAAVAAGPAGRGVRLQALATAGSRSRPSTASRGDACELLLSSAASRSTCSPRARWCSAISTSSPGAKRGSAPRSPRSTSDSQGFGAGRGVGRRALWRDPPGRAAPACRRRSCSGPSCPWFPTTKPSIEAMLQRGGRTGSRSHLGRCPESPPARLARRGRASQAAFPAASRAVPQAALLIAKRARPIAPNLRSASARPPGGAALPTGSARAFDRFLRWGRPPCSKGPGQEWASSRPLSPPSDGAWAVACCAHGSISRCFTGVTNTAGRASSATRPDLQKLPTAPLRRAGCASGTQARSRCSPPAGIC